MAEEKIHLRDARDTDSDAIIDLIAKVYAEYPGNVLDVEVEEPELLAPATSFERFWVAERGGRVVGTSALAARVAPGGSRIVTLKKLYLDPSVRGRGVARRLTERVEDHARGLGACVVELWTDTRFVPAHGFYAHLGYRRTGRTRELHDLSNTTEYEYVKDL